MAQSQKLRGQPRGRAIAKRRSPLPLIIIVVVLLALVIGAVLASTRSPSAVSVAPFQPRAVTAPTGLTPEGYAYKGKPDAPVTVTEYGDFQCPSCGLFATQAEAAFETQYVDSGKVRLIYHDFPLPQHEHAILAASAARAAGEQGKFWQMHELLFARQREWSTSANARGLMSGYANALGLDQKAFDQVLDAEKYTPALQAAAQQSSQRGVNSTPTFEVNGKLVDASQLAAAVEAALQGK